MTIVSWRIVQKRREKSAFNGEGAAKAPGRWNQEGAPIVYTAGSLALASLEILANVPDEQLARQTFVAIPAAFDEKIVLRIDITTLPENWTAIRPRWQQRTLAPSGSKAPRRPSLRYRAH